jgi:Protein of unknown function (DUF1236)
MRLTGAALLWNVSARKQFTPIERRTGAPAAGRVTLPVPEEEMHKAPIAALVMALSLVGIAATHAQAPPATAPQQDLAPVNPKLNLTLEQRHTIREIIKDKKADAAPADVAAAVGEPVPQGVAPRPMPSDVARKVPQVRAHNYFLTAHQIVIVDPKDNRVAEVIEREED